MHDVIPHYTFGQIHQRPGRYDHAITAVDQKTFELLKVGESVISGVRDRIHLSANQALDIHAAGISAYRLVDRQRNELQTFVNELWRRRTSLDDPDLTRQHILNKAAQHAVDYGVGNCGEQALVAYQLAHRELHQRKMDTPVMIYKKGFDHDVVCLGDSRATPERDVVVLDAWPVAATAHTLAESARPWEALSLKFSVHSSQAPMPLHVVDEQDTVVARSPLLSTSHVELYEHVQQLCKNELCFDHVSLAKDVSTIYKTASGDKARFSRVSDRQFATLKTGTDHRAQAEQALIRNAYC